MSNAPNKTEQYAREVAQDMIERLKQGTSPFQRLWVPGQDAMHMPYNAVSGKTYSTANCLRLWSQQELLGYTDSRWLSLRQGNSLGACVRKGEKGTRILMRFTRNDREENEQPQAEEAGNARPYFRAVPLFNAEQFDGLSPAPVRVLPGEFERHAKCEQLIEDVQASGLVITHDGENQAFYRPSTDSVHLPSREQFISGDAYYATILHEMGHATGHPSRLGRDLSGRFGSESYAREELRAELFSLMGGDRLSIGFNLGQHDAYVGHWIKLLEDDHKELFRACVDAEAICTYLKIEKYEHEPTPKLERQAEQSAAATHQAADVGDDERIAARMPLQARERSRDMGLSL